MSDIQRLDTNKRLSRVVIHNGVVHVAGVTSSDLTEDIGVQTRDVLNKIDPVNLNATLSALGEGLRGNGDNARSHRPHP